MRVVLADDSMLLREGLARLLAELDVEVVAQAANADELLAAVDEHRPDVAIVDIRMPPTHTDEGLRAAAAIRAKHPDTGVLVLSQYARPSYALELLETGAERVGYLLKDRVSDLAKLGESIRQVAEGGSVLDPSVVAQLVQRRRHAHDPLEELTDREREVLEQMAEGRTNRAIAERLVITEHTVEKHVRSIFGKLNLGESQDDHRRVLAVVTFLDNA